VTVTFICSSCSEIIKNGLKCFWKRR